MKCIQIASLFANYFKQNFIWEARGEKILFHGVSVILFETASYNKAASSGKFVCRWYPEARFHALMNILLLRKVKMW